MRASAVVAAVRVGAPSIGLVRATMIGLLGAAGLILLWHAIAVLGVWRVLAIYPYGVDYGEGIVWQQTLNIVAGRGYTPLGIFPAIVYHYPPVYHLLVGACMAAFGSDPLATGRFVTAAATSASVAIISILAAHVVGPTTTPLVRRLCGAAAGLAFLVSGPVVDWGMLMRVDMLACALGLAGLWFAIRAVDRPSLLHLASLCFVLATYTKQVAIAAPIAGIVGLAIGHRRLATLCFVETAALGIGVLVALEAATGGEFLRHILLYNVNRVDWSMVVALVYPLKMHIILIAMAVFGIADLVRQTRSHSDATTAILLIFTGLKTVMLLLIVKSGASLNYTIEWLAMIAIFFAVALAPVLQMCLGAERKRVEAVRLILAGGLVLQASWLPVKQPTLEEAQSQAVSREPLVAMIRAAQKPVIADEMTLLLRAGKPVLWEPAIVAELAHFHRYDERGFIDLIHAHRFAFFVTEGVPGDRLFDARYNREVTDAIDAAYPRREQHLGYLVHLPALSGDRASSPPA